MLVIGANCCDGRLGEPPLPWQGRFAETIAYCNRRSAKGQEIWGKQNWLLVSASRQDVPWFWL
jgi:hypothetical protein